MSLCGFPPVCEAGYTSPAPLLHSPHSEKAFFNEILSILLPRISWKNLSLPLHTPQVQTSEAALSHPHSKRDQLSCKPAWCLSGLL